MAIAVDGSLTIVEDVITPDFSGNPLEGTVPLAVQFEDLSSGEIDSYAWSFGDGGTSEEQHPTHVYEDVGDYTVSLTVTGGSGSVTETKEDYIQVNPDTQPPEIDSGPIVASVTDHSAHILWTTTELSDSRVVYCSARIRPHNFTEAVELLSDEQAVTVDRATEMLLQGDLPHFDDLGLDTPLFTIDCGREIDLTLTFDHKVELSSLTPSTFYLFRVRSVDVAGNASRWKGGYLITEETPDDDAPEITLGPSAEVGPEEAHVKWITDEFSDSYLQYAVYDDDDDDDVFDGAEEILVTDLVLEHEIWIEGLQSGTSYIYRVRSTDAAGNSSRLKLGKLHTPDEDGEAPEITKGPKATTRKTKAVVRWRTDEGSHSRVDYGTSEDFGLFVEDDDLVRRHRSFLTDLEPSTLYHYQVSSTDVSGNTASSETHTFVTKQGDDTRPCKFVRRPYIIKRFHNKITIGWEMDEDANGQIEFGPTRDYGRFIDIATPGTRHVVTLTGFTPGSRYHCNIRMVDLAGNGPTSSEDFELETAAAEDTEPPSISGDPAVRTRGHDRITVAWKTNEASDSVVEYGTTTAYGLIAESPDPTREHVVTLTRLSAGTTYHFRVSSKDPDGNGPTVSDDFTATTIPGPDVTTPLILSGPDVVDKSSRGAFIEWLTDEPTDLLVDFGPDLNYGSEVTSDDFQRLHRVMLVGEPGIEYHYRVTSTDEAGNEPVTSRDHTFILDPPEDDDEDPPSIRKLHVRKVTGSSAFITWSTTRPTDSIVRYGLTEVYSDDVGLAKIRRRHAAFITGLNPGTTYHYQVQSADIDGLTAFSEDATLTTDDDEDELSPEIVFGPEVVASHATATFSWKTNEPCFGAIAVGTETELGTASEQLFEEEEPGDDHNVTVTGLQAGVRYFFALIMKDLSGNRLTFGNRNHGAGKVVRPLLDAGEISFTTDVDEDLQPPIFLSGPVKLSSTDTEAVIAWDTDEVSDTRLWLVAADGSRTLADFVPEHGFAHQVLLTGLSPATTYTVVAASADPVGNGPSESQQLSFTTPTEPDNDAPVLTGVPQIIAIEDRSATISWSTNEGATAVLDYGDFTLDQSIVVTDASPQQTVKLTNLAPATSYQFRVSVTDAFGNGPSRSSVQAFATAIGPDELAPQITAGPTVEEVTDRSAIIAWTTNEGTDGFVHFGTNTLDAIVGRAEVELHHSVELTNLDPATAYSFNVASADAAGNGPTTSAELVLTTTAGPDLTPPEVPSVLSVRQSGESGQSTVYVSWVLDPFEDIAGYNVYRDIAGDFERIAGPVDGLEYADNGLPEGGEFRYYITALDGANPPNESDASDILTLLVHDRPGDFQGDGIVNFTDFFLMADVWGRSASDPGYDSIFDLDGDGHIALGDFFLFADVFGTRYDSGKAIVSGSSVDADSALPPLRLSQEEAAEPNQYLVSIISETGGQQGHGITLEYDADSFEFLRAVQAEPERGSEILVVLADNPGSVALGRYLPVLPTADDGSGAQTAFSMIFRTWPGASTGQVRIAEAFAVDTQGTVTAFAVGPQSRLQLQPQQFELFPNYPNPFNPQTSIRFQLPSASRVWLRVFDVLGQEVTALATGEELSAGLHQLEWNGQDHSGRAVASGVYLYALEADSFRQVRKLLLLR